MARASWAGVLRFSLISVPVKGYTAAAGGGEKTASHFLHATCCRRIQYRKFCPCHGEVENDQIVAGYEVAPDEYVTVGAGEKAELRAADTKTITVDGFVDPAGIDPVYFSGRSLFLVPDGEAARTSYGVLLDAMRHEARWAVARVVFAGREQVAVVRPGDGVLAMSVLHFPASIRTPADFADEVGPAAASAEERALVQALIGAPPLQGLDLGRYKDEYGGRLAELVAGKSRANAVRAAGGGDEPAVDHPDARRQSLDRAGGGQEKTGRAARQKTPRRPGG